MQINLFVLCAGTLSIQESKVPASLVVCRQKGICFPCQLFVCAIRRSTDNGINNTGNDYVELNSGFAEAASHSSTKYLAIYLATGEWAWLPSRPESKPPPPLPPQQLCNQVLIKDVHSLLVCVLKCFRLKTKTKKNLCFPLDVTQMWLLFVRFVFTVPCAIVMSWKCSIPLQYLSAFQKEDYLRGKKLQHETFHSSLSVSLSLSIYWFSLCRTSIAHFQNRCSNVESNRAHAETQRVIQHQHAFNQILLSCSVS